MATNCSYVRNVLDRLKNAEVKYILFGVIGGFYFSPHFQPWIKSWWLRFNLLFGSIYWAILIGYFATADYGDWKTMCFACSIAQNLTFGTVVVPILIFYFREEMNLVLSLNTREDKMIVENTQHLRRMKNNITYINITFSLLFAFLAVAHLTYPLIAVNDDYLHNANFYAMPHPFVQNINSPRQYVYCSLILLFISGVVFLPIFIFHLNVLVVAYEFYTAFSIICGRVAKLSTSSEITFEQTNENNYTFDVNPRTASASRGKETEVERQKMMQSMVDAIKDYQRLRRAVKMMKPYIELQFSIIIVDVVVTQLLVISTVHSSNMTNIDEIRGLMAEAFVAMLYFCHCYAGRIFTEMGEMAAAQIYNIPWYDMDPRRRKTFYIFLHLAQKPIRFCGYKIYEMGMPTFLQFAKISYTYFNFLNRLETTRDMMPS